MGKEYLEVEMWRCCSPLVSHRTSCGRHVKVFFIVRLAIKILSATSLREPLYSGLDSTAADKDHSLKLYRNQRFP